MNYITDPVTFNNVHIRSHEGIELLKHYIKMYQYGGGTNNSGDSDNTIESINGGGAANNGGGAAINGGGAAKDEENNFYIYTTGICNWDINTFDVVAEYTIIVALKIMYTLLEQQFTNFELEQQFTNFEIIHHDPVVTFDQSDQFQQIDQETKKKFIDKANGYLNIILRHLNNENVHVRQHFMLGGTDGYLPMNDSNTIFKGRHPHVVIDNGHLFWYRKKGTDMETIWNVKVDDIGYPVVKNINAIDPGFPGDVTKFVIPQQSDTTDARGPENGMIYFKLLEKLEKKYGPLVKKVKGVDIITINERLIKNEKTSFMITPLGNGSGILPLYST